MVNYFLDQGGVESRKLILVLSSLCSTFTLKNSSISELGAPSKGSGSMDKFPSSICGLSPFFEVNFYKIRFNYILVIRSEKYPLLYVGLR